MPANLPSLGGRLPLMTYDRLKAEQKRLCDAITGAILPWAASASFRVQDAEGRFIGPFGPALLHPELARSFLALQYAEAGHSILSERLRQIIILTVGGVWQADYELYAHSAVARHAGLADDVVIALVAGSTPDGLPPDETIAHLLARQLVVERRVDDGLYRLAEEFFGRQGVLDIVMLVGIYQTVCGLLNIFEIPAPGAAPVHTAEFLG